MLLKKLTAGLVACAAALIFGATLAHALLNSSDGEIIATNSEPPSASLHSAVTPENYPARLIIPSLSIDTKVQYVGITAHGTMSVPNNFTDVGWYKYGSVPGEKGSAVMAGHVDNALALPGVFKYLKDIEMGADIFIIEKNGTQLHFVVNDIQSYGATDAPSSRIFDEHDVPRLNLVTCEGDWVQAEHQYDHRLVVYSHIVP